MEIGIALPTMATGFSRATFVEWCEGIDGGPYSSISSGERITFHNPELLVTTTAAAALTERVRVVTNITVLPLHRPALLAKQLATLDVLAAGRLVVGVGVGGREQDYRALGVPFEGRHGTLDAGVAELRRLWDGGPAYDGGQPVGPAPFRRGAPAAGCTAPAPLSVIIGHRFPRRQTAGAAPSPPLRHSVDWPCGPPARSAAPGQDPPVRPWEGSQGGNSHERLQRRSSDTDRARSLFV